MIDYHNERQNGFLRWRHLFTYQLARFGRYRSCSREDGTLLESQRDVTLGFIKRGYLLSFSEGCVLLSFYSLCRANLRNPTSERTVSYRWIVMTPNESSQILMICNPIIISAIAFVFHDAFVWAHHQASCLGQQPALSCQPQVTAPCALTSREAQEQKKMKRKKKQKASRDTDRGAQPPQESLSPLNNPCPLSRGAKALCWSRLSLKLS